MREYYYNYMYINLIFSGSDKALTALLATMLFISLVIFFLRGVQGQCFGDWS